MSKKSRAAASRYKSVKVSDRYSVAAASPTGVWHWLPIVIILCVASVLILSNLGGQCLWQDEAQTALISKTIITHGIPIGYDGKNYFSQDLGAECGNGFVWKYHTWLPFYVLAVFFKVLGTSTLVARLPFALFGIATIYATYLLTYRLSRRRLSALTAGTALTACVPYLILVRQCRYYAPAAFFVVLSLYVYTLVLDKRRYAPAFFVIATTLLFHCQYTLFPPVIAAVVVHSLLFRRDRLKIVFVSSVAAVVIAIPYLIWLLGMSKSFSATYGDRGHGPERIIAAGATFVGQLFQYAFPAILLALPVLAAIYYGVREKRVPKVDVEALGWIVFLLIYTIATIAVEAAFAPAPFFRYLVAILPVCALFIGIILGRHHVMIAVIALIAMVATSPMGDYLFEITHQYRGPIEGIVEYLNSHAKPNDVVVMTYGDLPVKFYTNLRVVGGLTGEDLTPARSAKWVIIRKSIICEKDKAVADYVARNVRGTFEPIDLPYPDVPFENREEPSPPPGGHRFRSPTSYDAPDVTIYRRLSPNEVRH